MALKTFQFQLVFSLYSSIVKVKVYEQNLVLMSRIWLAASFHKLFPLSKLTKRLYISLVLFITHRFFSRLITGQWCSKQKDRCRAVLPVLITICLTIFRWQESVTESTTSFSFQFLRSQFQVEQNQSHFGESSDRELKKLIANAETKYAVNFWVREQQLRITINAVYRNLNSVILRGHSYQLWKRILQSI